jgi:hypothetical protein
MFCKENTFVTKKDKYLPHAVLALYHQVDQHQQHDYVYL